MISKNKVVSVYEKIVKIMDQISPRRNVLTGELETFCGLFNSILRKYDYKEVSMKNTTVYETNQLLFMYGPPKKKKYNGLALAEKNGAYIIAGLLEHKILLSEANYNFCRENEITIFCDKIIENEIIKNKKISNLYRVEYEKSMNLLGQDASSDEIIENAKENLIKNEQFNAFYDRLIEQYPYLAYGNRKMMIYNYKNLLADIESWEELLKLSDMFTDKTKKKMVTLGCLLTENI